MEIKAIDDMLAQLRATSALAKGTAAGGTAGAGTAAPAAGVDFGSALRAALDDVNSAQSSAGGLAQQYELGTSNVGLHDVVIAMQKANIAFQGTVQVRNKVVAAYNEIMNMQI